MTVPVYSTLLISSALAGSGTAAFLVPAGFRCVVRDIQVFESSPGGLIAEAAGNDGVVFWGGGPNLTSTFNVYEWHGHLVVDELKQLEVSLTLAGNVYASGYLLSLP